MNTRAGAILVVDDEASICDVLSVALRKDGHRVVTETNPLRAEERCRQEDFDVVVQDLKMPELDGIELLRRIKKNKGDGVAVVVMTAYSTWERAVEAMRLGAFGYIRKPFDTNLDLRATIARAMLVKSLKDRSDKDPVEVTRAVGGMVGNSEKMRHVYELIRKSAPTDSTVLITGESGVGKELAAKAIHFGSPRLENRFVAVNCGEFTETLLESELFGHVKGAFTGAVADKTGVLEHANGGTFFLDEIGDMSVQLQTKILRVLEEREVKPVGGVQSRRIDVRFIAATNRDLEKEVETGRFRQDLFYRLNVIPVRIPSLRERRDDIPLLAGHFLSFFSERIGRKVRRFSDGARMTIMEYHWPGNVRELENVIRRAVTLADGEEITKVDIGALAAAEAASPAQEEAPIPEGGVDLDDRISEYEKGYLLEALRMAEGNYTKAAQLLKMSLRSFRYKIQKYKISQ